jgi:hypothetical protein
MQEQNIQRESEVAGHGANLGGKKPHEFGAKPEEKLTEDVEGHARSTGPKPHEFGAKPEDNEGEDVEGHMRSTGPKGQGIW